MAELLGRECYTYYNSNTYASPTLVAISQAIDVSFNIDKSYGDVSSRASGWKKQKPGLKDLSVTFGYRYKNGTDAVMDVLRAAAIADTQTELFILDGPTSAAGNEGLRAVCDLTFGRDEPLEDGVQCPFKAVHTPDSSNHDPSWYTTT